MNIFLTIYTFIVKKKIPEGIGTSFSFAKKKKKSKADILIGGWPSSTQ